MSNIKSNLVRKKIGEKHHRGFEIQSEEKPLYKIVTTSEYTSNGEELILVKDVVQSKITLDSNTTSHIIIKAMTKVYIVPSQNFIDEYYKEILIDKGACVEFYLLEDNWYIVSSDGLKLN